MKKIYILFVSLLVLGIGAGIFYLTIWRDSGVQIPDVTMETAYGEKYSFYDDKEEKIRLLEFVYTNCPDICPTTTFKMTQIREELKKEDVFGNKVEFVTITIDPKRDTQDVLQTYADTFQITPTSGWVMIRGSEEGTRALADAFNFMYRDPGNGYLIHSSYTYLIDEKNRLLETFGMGEGFDKERVLKRILREVK